MKSLTQFNHQDQCITFKLDQNLIGINILDIREIVPCKRITRIAQAQDFVKGLMNLRGQILTILDIGVLLGLSKRNILPGSYVIVFKQRDVGFIVDKIGDVVGIDTRDIDEIPANINPKVQEYMANVINQPSQILMLLNAKKILSNTMAQITGNKES